MRYLPFQQDGWQGQVLEDFAPCVSAVLAKREGGRVVVQAPYRTVSRLEAGDIGWKGAVFAKWMKAQNDGALKKGEWLAHLRWAWGTPRAISLFSICLEMLEHGHLCPQPLLALWKRSGDGWHQNLFVAAALECPTVEESLQQAADEAAREQIVRAVAAKLAAFHRDGFAHGDFLPRNCCMDGEGRLFYLDNDKTKRWRLFSMPFFMQKRNLAQFGYNLLRLRGFETCREELPRAFLEEYSHVTGRNAMAVWKGVRSRWQKNHDLRRRDVLPLF